MPLSHHVQTRQGFGAGRRLMNHYDWTATGITVGCLVSSQGVALSDVGAWPQDPTRQPVSGELRQLRPQ